jgi:hypothetical protein
MSGGHDDYAVEPIRGLPEKLPAGEDILWQGAPSWWELAKSVFHIRAVALYFAVLMVWRGSVHINDPHHAVAAVLAALSLLPICSLGLGMLALLAWLSSRTSVYTITNRRIVMRVGVALPTAINIPFSAIESAGVVVNRAGAAYIPLSLTDATRIPYSTLWPHARPWRFNKPQPMLRGVPDGAKVAKLLDLALHATFPAASSSVMPSCEIDKTIRTPSGRANPAYAPQTAGSPA